MIRNLIFIIFCFHIKGGFVENQKAENPEWELSKSKNEISIYLRSVDYSDYKEFKGEMVVNSSPDKIVSFLQHIESFKKWLPDCLESKKLIQISAKEQINYILTDVPWPYDDRDIIYQFSVSDRDLKTGQIKIILSNKPGFVAVKKNVVRIPQSEGCWTITPINNNQTLMVYQMHVEPGGYVPAWLANLKIVDTPYNFLHNLRDQIEK